VGLKRGLQNAEERVFTLEWCAGGSLRQLLWLCEHLTHRAGGCQGLGPTRRPQAPCQPPPGPPPPAQEPHLSSGPGSHPGLRVSGLLGFWAAWARAALGPCYQWPCLQPCPGLPARARACSLTLPCLRHTGALDRTQPHHAPPSPA